MNSIAAAAASVEAVASIYHLETTEKNENVRMNKYGSRIAFVGHRSYMHMAAWVLYKNLGSKKKIMKICITRIIAQ